jgi:hypothetical protein
MSTYKNTSGDYTITVTNGTGIFTVNAANIKLNGQVTQIGNTTTVFDFITVAANNTGDIHDMGLLAQTGPATFAGLRFDTVANAWQISNSVTSAGVPITSYANILTTTNLPSSVAGSNTQIQFNQSNAFGASSSLTFDYANNKLTLQGYEVFGNIGTTPSVPSNAVAMYNNTIGEGGTGVYVLSSGVNDELISKSKALTYSIIF